MAGKEPKKKWGWVFSAVGLAIGGGILMWLLFYIRDNVDVGAVLSAIRPIWLVAALCCIPVFELLDARVYYIMGRGMGCRASALGCLDAVAIGEFYYRLGPVGAPVQLGLLLSAGYTGSAAATVYTWKAVANTVGYTVYAVAALLARLFLFRQETAAWAIWAVGALVCAYVALCAAVFLLAARPGPVKRLCARLLHFLARHIRPLAQEGRVEFLLAKLDEFCADMNALRSSRALLLRVLGLMALEMTALFAIPAFLYLGLGLEGVTFGELLLTQCLVMVLSRVVAIPGNAGGAEGSFYLFMAPLFGETLAVAVVLWRFAAFLEVLLLGGLWSVARFLRRAGGRPRRTA